MLDQTFLIKLALSFLVGSVWITSVTVIAERFGSKIGGFIGGLPSTIVVALLFIGLSQSTQDASRAAVMIPMVMGVNGLFILIYLARVHKGLVQALLTALAVWFVVIAGIVMSGVESAFVSFLVWAISLGVAYYITEHVMHIAHKGGVRVPYTTRQIVTRGVVSGFIISLAVLISRLTGPVIGGIASNFPVIFMSTLFITYRTGGAEFSRAVAKTLMISGMINVGVYSFTAHFAYHFLDLASGTLLAVIVSGLSAMVAYRIIRKLTQEAV
ncbi:MAG: DUF3147 family protein [Candidatus Marinimicrobia bacterium]|nr:DUF3147 family protein [Candidatus Neomarinimicrobiota bacterium]